MTEEREITAEEARRFLEAEERRGEERCRSRIEQALREEGYTLEGIPSYVKDGDGWKTVVVIQLRKVTSP